MVYKWGLVQDDTNYYKLFIYTPGIQHRYQTWPYFKPESTIDKPSFCDILCILPKTNIAPENRSSQKERIIFEPSIFMCKNVKNVSVQWTAMVNNPLIKAFVMRVPYMGVGWLAMILHLTIQQFSQAQPVKPGPPFLQDHMQAVVAALRFFFRSTKMVQPYALSTYR